ncbi:MAG TPA: ABC transporter ATP-binding protein [Flavipsychrobacter sp.]|nr:ABC transporter ATP-binding protein [Flavipsychrobacter sp.]
MTHLTSLNKYFVRYKWRLLLGLIFVSVSNFFAVASPVVVRNVLDQVQKNINIHDLFTFNISRSLVTGYIYGLVLWNGLLLLGLALMRGVFMFMMRQTLIVMSRHIEYDQKNEIFNHYQQLHTHFYKTHYTGDLMNRMAEDVSRVRMYTGPSIMYATNVLVLTIMCVWNMVHVNPMLTLYVMLPLPILAFSIYYVNKIIYKKSGKIQAQLSDLTTTAQESYSGIRVIKSFVQEKNMLGYFKDNSEKYRKSSINLALTEAIYFPTMNLFVGLSMLTTILIGGYLAIHGKITTGNIAEFVIYINLLMFPISSIGAVASMIQRASASQKRIDEFLHTEPEIVSPLNPVKHSLQGSVDFKDVSFTYAHTGIKALQHFSLNIKPGQKVAVIGKTGSGKSTLAHLLLRMYDAQQGEVLLDNISIKEFDPQDLRKQISYAPQEAFLFSDTIYNNIKFGRDDATEADVKEAARLADLEKDIATLSKGYETVIGERGVMLSGGQKQRMVLARALLKNSKLLIMDESLSAVDTQTEKTILGNLQNYLEDKTTIVITHRIFTNWVFDQIIVIDDGHIAEHGTHDELMQLNGRYAKLYRHQTEITEEQQV